VLCVAVIGVRHARSVCERMYERLCVRECVVCRSDRCASCQMCVRERATMHVSLLSQHTHLSLLCVVSDACERVCVRECV